MRLLFIVFVFILLNSFSCDRSADIDYRIINTSNHDLIVECQIDDEQMKVHRVMSGAKTLIYIEYGSDITVDELVRADSLISWDSIHFFKHLSVYRVINDSSFLLNDNYYLRSYWDLKTIDLRSADYELVIE